jgi:Mg-chelatase subunit ChlD
MNDPVMDPEGHSYERSAIEAWLKANSESPMTRSPLTASQLIPNRGLRDAIAAHLATQKSAGAQAEAATSTVAATSTGPVSLGCSFVADPLNAGSHLLMLEALTPPASSRVPVDICCVVDVSGSMSAEAKIQTSEGDGESHGLSMLDIVKHAVRVIIGLLNTNDRMSLVTYSNQATLVFPPLNMNDAGKARAMSQVGQMNAYGGTNLWDGLQTAMETLRTSDREGRVGSIMLLTDGVPNLNPPRGILPMLTKYQQNTPLDAAINTFGFGYNLESDLLEAIAAKGNGMYSFIPDSGMVGTAFIHSLANTLVQLGKAEVEVSATENLAVMDPGTIPGAPWPRLVDLGVLQFGASRSLILQAQVQNASGALGSLR